MNVLKLIVDFIAALITLIIGIKSLSFLFKTKISLKITNIIIIVLSSIAIVFYSYYGNSLTRPLNNLIILFVCSLLIYKENIYKTLLYVLICNVLIGFYEVVLSFFLITFKVVDLKAYDNDYVLKAIFSFIVMLLVLFTVKKSFVQKIVNKIVENKKLTKYIVILLLMFSLLIMVIDFNNTQAFKYTEYLGNIIMVICIAVLLFTIAKDHLQVQKEIEKSAILLNFMEKYERIIDENRENNHELLNNLLVLRSIKNKNSNEYKLLLNDLISNFDSKKTSFKNIYNLPPGIKGIFYYKFYGLDENNYQLNINVSKKVSKKFKNINYDNYIKLSKIIAIILDNAIEASSKTKEKSIFVDVYEENDKIIIDVINSFDGKVDIETINDKNYSTKGNNRGYGLYIMKKIISDNESINVNQEIKDNLFFTKISVNEK